jgi:hypothetical protein
MSGQPVAIWMKDSTTYNVIVNRHYTDEPI